MARKKNVEDVTQDVVEAPVKVTKTAVKTAFDVVRQNIKEARAAFHNYRSTAHFDKNRFKLKR